MFKYEDDFLKWARWALGSDGYNGSRWEYKDKTVRFTPSCELEEKIEAAVCMVHRGDKVAANVVRANYVHRENNQTQEDMAKQLGVSLATYKAKLRKGRKLISLSVFGDTGF